MNINMMISRFRRKIVKILSYPSNTFRAFSFLFRVIRAKSDDSYVIFLTTLIGDSVYGLAYIDALKKKSGNEIIVIGHERNKCIIESYNSIDRIVYLNNDKYREVNTFLQSSWASEYGLRYKVINSNPFYYEKCHKAKNSDALFQLKTHILGIEGCSKITYHSVPVKDVSSIPNFLADMDKIVIINPYSNSLSNSKVKLFEEMVQLLLEKGYIVYCNVISNQKPIEGTQELRCSMEEIYSIATKIKLIISIRSGLLDYLAPSNVNMFVIYDNCSQRLQRMYHLSNWNCKGLIEEVYLKEKNDDETLHRLNSLLVRI